MIKIICLREHVNSEEKKNTAIIPLKMTFPYFKGSCPLLNILKKTNTPSKVHINGI